MIGEIVAIEKIECLDEFVYNLEVEAQTEENKNFFADGVLVSNCHSVSGTSAEALLKVLEEPPAHVRFILCTTESEAMTATIRSRCQSHQFKKIYWRVIADQLEKVAKLESIDYEPEALSVCARLANGSMRNGLNNLEELASFVGSGKITAEHAHQMFAQVPEMILYDIIDEVIGEEGKPPDGTKGFKIVNYMLSHGSDFNTIYNAVAEHLRCLMVGLSASAASELISISEEGKKRLKEQLRRCKNKLGCVTRCLMKLQEAKKAVEYNISPEAALDYWFLESVMIFRETP